MQNNGGRVPAPRRVSMGASAPPSPEPDRSPRAANSATVGATIRSRRETLTPSTVRIRLTSRVPRSESPTSPSSTRNPRILTCPSAGARPLAATAATAATTTADDAGERAGSPPEIEFDRVSFHYPAAAEVSLASLEAVANRTSERTGDFPVLRELTFRARAGRLTALVGPSGAGKTTITHLVPRLYDPTAGTVRIDGQDIKDLTLASLHEAVGVVSQETYLFHDTVRANLLYAHPEASERDLLEACDAAGNRRSRRPPRRPGHRGGRSRLQLIRRREAACRHRTPAVEESADRRPRRGDRPPGLRSGGTLRALKTALADRTSLVIAHRLSTIREADQILVVDAGTVVERGTHEELLAADARYARLHRAQFAGEHVH